MLHNPSCLPICSHHPRPLAFQTPHLARSPQLLQYHLRHSTASSFTPSMWPRSRSPPPFRTPARAQTKAHPSMTEPAGAPRLEPAPARLLVPIAARACLGLGQLRNGRLGLLVAFPLTECGPGGGGGREGRGAGWAGRHVSETSVLLRSSLKRQWVRTFERAPFRE